MMPAFCYGDRYDMSALYIQRNVDGVNNEVELLGYIGLDPFTLLSRLITKYYVAEYGDFKLFRTYSVSFNYSLVIKKIGCIYNPYNFSLPRYQDFETLNSAIGFYAERASIENDGKEEYFKILMSAKEENNEIQKAIDLSSIFDIVTEFSNALVAPSQKHKLFDEAVTKLKENFAIDDQDVMNIIKYTFNQLCNKI